MAKKEKKPKEKKYTAGQILEMVDKKMSSDSFDELTTQMENDFNLFSLVPYEAEKDHQSYTSPSPKNDFLKVFHGVNKANLMWQIVTPEDAPEKERDAANKGEQLITGILDRADRRLRTLGEPPLRNGLSWHGCGRGMAGLKCLIYVDDSKDTQVDIRALDPMHMAWEQGQDGLVWGAFLYHVSKAEAEERYDITLKEGEDAIVIDFFDRVNNAVVLVKGSAEGKKESEFVKDPTPHGLNHVPIWLGFASGMPTVFTKENEPTLKQRAASVYASSRGIYEPKNKQVSFIMDTAEKSVAGTMTYETDDGKKSIEGDPFGNWKVIRLKKGEVLKTLDPPKVPSESAVILSVLDRDKQESTVPYPIGYGIDPGTHSGTALTIMNDNTRSSYDPFCGMLADAFRWLCEEILIQFKTKGQKMKLKGFDSSGKFFVMEANPHDIEDDWYINVTCEPKLPRDEAGELQMALAATQARQPFGRPILSDYTAREKYMKIPNPDAEDERIEEQQIRRMIEQMPNVQVRRVAQELLDKGDKQGAVEFLSSISSPMQGQQQQGGQQGIPPEAMEILQQASKQLGIPVEQLAQMPVEEVKARLAGG